MTYKFPLVELLDRYVIAQLKFEKLRTNYEEVEFYTKQLKEYDFESIKDELNQLTEIHRRIWALEDDFKNFTIENKYDLAEIGRRAIVVRDTNYERYQMKNKIAEKLNDPVREKKNYGDKFII
jgi:hypothetical protein